LSSFANTLCSGENISLNQSNVTRTGRDFSRSDKAWM